MRAYNICLTERHLQKELHHLHKTFTETNGYPEWIYQQVDKKIKENRECVSNITQTVTKIIYTGTELVFGVGYIVMLI